MTKGLLAEMALARPREASSVRDTAERISQDVAAVSRIEAIPHLLDILCEFTGLRFAAVARVTDETWTACAVKDGLDFGLQAGGQLDVNTTLCMEARAASAPIAIDHASTDPRYHDHPTPPLYHFESYVSVPIVLSTGRYFGNLCALDPRATQVSDPRTLALFEGFAALIAAQLEEELEREHERRVHADEREASELREQFIAVLGHDLRNPLQAICATAELLERRSTDSVLVDMARRIKLNGKRMSALIDDVVDFARARLGSGLDIQFRDVNDLEDALTRVVEEIQDGNPERSIVVDIKIDRLVRCDLARLQQLLSNLIANALTHGAPHSAIRVTVTSADHDLLIDVWNAGEAIPPQALRKIFDPFWRQTTSKNRQGLGLGLHICSHIVRSHEGQLSATSTVEGGTRFTARIPIVGNPA